MKKSNKPTLKIEFSNKIALDHFARWLCESGEQQYWDWMEYREQDDDGDITATIFEYHGPDKNKWLHNDTIVAECSRLDKER